MSSRVLFPVVLLAVLLFDGQRGQAGPYAPNRGRSRQAAVMEKYGSRSGVRTAGGEIQDGAIMGPHEGETIIEDPMVGQAYEGGQYFEQPYETWQGGFAAGNCPPGGANCGCSPWYHRTSIFGEFLYLRPRNNEVAYAVPIDGPIVPPGDNAIQIGRTATTDPEYDPGFRVGFSLRWDDCTSIVATYTHYESETEDSTEVAAPDLIRSLVLHPLNNNAAIDVLSASAQYDIDFQLADVDYRTVWWHGDRHAINWVAGARFGHMDQTFSSQFNDIGTVAVDTDISFDGAGIRMGFDAERHARNRGLFVYGKGIASFLAGEFQAQYTQTDTFQQAVVDSSFEAGRLVPVLDLELGLGWISPMGGIRLSAGYLISAWFNMVKTDDFIKAVQNNNYIDLHHPFSFDGLAARAELRW